MRPLEKRHGSSEPETRLVADPRQDGAEGDARQLQRGAFEVEQMAFFSSPQRQRDPVGTEQRLERRIFVVVLG
jgi:hypothetical protein